VWQMGSQAKIVVVVDEDIDPFDLGQVWWAVATRTQGSRDFEVHPYGRTSRSDPSVLKERGEFTDVVLIDATKKLDYPYVEAWGGTGRRSASLPVTSWSWWISNGSAR